MSLKPKILIVEDDPLIGLDLSKTLSSFGYTVQGPLDSGEKVLEQLEMLAPDFILMDIGLKGDLDGIKTAEAVQAKAATPIVFLSGLNDEETLQRAALTNQYGYLIKPFDGEELRTTIEFTLRRFKSQPKATLVADKSEEVGAPVFTIAPADGDTQASINSYLSQLPLFQGVSSKALLQLSQQCAVKEFEAGDFLSLGGDSTQGGFIPITGRVSVTKSADSGKELIVSLLAPGNVLGLLYTNDTFAESTSARTQLTSKVIWIPTSSWEHFLEHEPSVYKRYAEMLIEALTSAYSLSSSLAHARVEGRIMNTLLALLPNFGKSVNQSNNESRIYITRKELAELTGTTPETAIRVTKNLEKEGLLDLTRPGIIKFPNLKKLRDAVAN